MTKPEIFRQIDAEVAVVMKKRKWVTYPAYYKNEADYGEAYSQLVEYSFNCKATAFGCCEGRQAKLGLRWDEGLPHYTTDANAAEEVEKWLCSLDAAIVIEQKRNCLGVWRCFIFPSSSELLDKLPCCHSHMGSAARTLALSLAILPEERREYYSKLLGECEDAN